MRLTPWNRPCFVLLSYKLQPPDLSKPFRVHTDASDVAIAAVLEQERDSAWHLVAYTSRKLTIAETNCIAERKTLAVVFMEVVPIPLPYTKEEWSKR